MAQIRIDLAETLVDGMDIKFKAPCACNEITGLIVYYPAEDETIQSKELFFRDAHGNDLTGIGNLFSKDAYVKIIADTVNGYAYLQNADNNGYLNSAILGTYIHDAENLIGSGENGKFKATVSGTISSILVNGVSCSVKCGEESSMDLVAGCWYTFILDGNTVNFIKGGAGGGGLNFKVVGGTTEPVSPSENTIWVNTDTPITGYEFSATEPAELVEGLVWITVGAYSSVAFNALKNNSVMVYPLSAKQYVGGAWVGKEAKSYQGDEWVEWIVYLFDNGDQFEIVTGGWWQNPNLALFGSSAMGTATVGDTLKIQSYDSGGKAGILTTKNKIDLTNLNTITVVADKVSLSPILAIHSFSSGNLKDSEAILWGITVGENSLDISALSGKYYVSVGSNANAGGEFSRIKMNV